MTQINRIAIYIDVENVLYEDAGCPCADDLAGLVRDLRCYGEVVQTVAVGNRALMRQLVPVLHGERIRGFVHEGGPDAADLALIGRLRSEVPAGIDTVFICSGDHAFAAVARELRAAGKRVVVCSRAGRLSNELRAAADGVRVIPEPVQQQVAG